MKTKITFLTMILSFLIINSISAQEVKKNDKKDKKYEVVEIQTSAICGQCKDRLEHDIAFEKGVKSVELDDETKILKIKFKKGKNNKENLKKAITKVGYDADDLPADQKAYNALPECCKKGNDPH
ncbi:MAG: MerP protein [Marinilabiliales bacterium]|nr:MAG: MerP protein [Marinilabiliales bacterium]